VDCGCADSRGTFTDDLSAPAEADEPYRDVALLGMHAHGFESLSGRIDFVAERGDLRLKLGIQFLQLLLDGFDIFRGATDVAALPRGHLLVKT